ncbi:MAG TPA: FGGY family carbohydrate kinase, partial [Armatimonadota bacterium]|nr:FGGY family carbohydrate kinase [Armatimonadota bacterium]
FSSQGQTFVALDERGRPLAPFIVWLDGRAREIARRWEQQWLGRERYRRICGYPWVPAELALFKIAWLAEHRPKVHAAAHFLCLPDYMIWRLTGEMATDRAIAQQSGMYDVRAGEWSAELLGAAGINAGQLPAVHPPGTVVGGTRARAAAELAVAPRVPVCLGCNDQLAGAIGAGNVRPGPVTETTGTSLAVIATTSQPLDDERMYVGPHAAGGMWHAMPFAPASGIVLRWLRDLCRLDHYGDLLAGVERIPPGSEGLTVLPHVAGTASPTFNPEARGAMVGLTLGHGRAHLARAIMESCACLLRELLGPLREHGIEPTGVRSLGGAARSDLWLQMKADMLGLPVERPSCSSAASLGAAMLAATGTGQFESVEQAADAWYRPGDVFEPDLALRPAYDELYARYLRLYRDLYAEPD